MINVNTPIWLAHKRFPSRSFSCNSTGKTLNSILHLILLFPVGNWLIYFPVGENNNRFFFEMINLYLFSRFRSCSCYKNDEWKPTYNKGGSRHKNLCMTRVLGFLIRYFSNYYTLHRSDLAARAAPLDPRLYKDVMTFFVNLVHFMW